jgi:ABC-type branched-subunit amino acid transport system ATPase component
MTVLLVEKDVHLALSSADQCYVLDGVVRLGRASELINDPKVQRAYLGF